MAMLSAKASSQVALIKAVSFTTGGLGLLTDWRPTPATAPPFYVSPLENAHFMGGGSGGLERGGQEQGAVRNRGSKQKKRHEYG